MEPNASVKSLGKSPPKTPESRHIFSTASIPTNCRSFTGITLFEISSAFAKDILSLNFPS